MACRIQRLTQFVLTLSCIMLVHIPSQSQDRIPVKLQAKLQEMTMHDTLTPVVYHFIRPNDCYKCVLMPQLVTDSLRLCSPTLLKAPVVQIVSTQRMIEYRKYETENSNTFPMIPDIKDSLRSCIPSEYLPVIVVYRGCGYFVKSASTICSLLRSNE